MWICLPHCRVDDWIDAGVDEGDEMENDANEIEFLRKIVQFQHTRNFQSNGENQFWSPANEKEKNHQDQHLDYLQHTTGKDSIN